MLVLSRKTNESIMIGDEIEVIVLDVREGSVKIGINAPRTITVHRQEVYEEIMEENQRAQTQHKETLASAAEALKGSIPKKIKRNLSDETQKASRKPKAKSEESIKRLGQAIYQRNTTEP